MRQDNKRRMAVVPASAGGKHARSRVRVLGHNAKHDVSLAEVEIFTGRTHQIRVHCASLGAPVAGDDVCVLERQRRPATRPASQASGSACEGTTV